MINATCTLVEGIKIKKKKNVIEVKTSGFKDKMLSLYFLHCLCTPDIIVCLICREWVLYSWCSSQVDTTLASEGMKLSNRDVRDLISGLVKVRWVFIQKQSLGCPTAVLVICPQTFNSQFCKNHSDLFIVQ